MFRRSLVFLSLLVLFSNYGRAADIPSSADQGDSSSKLADYKTYYSKDDPKTRGLNFKIEYPADWEAKAGNRPHIVCLLIKTEFKDKIPKTAAVTVSINKFPDDLTEDVDLLFTENGAKTLIPANAEFINFQKIKLEGSDAVLVEFLQKRGLWVKCLLCVLIKNNYFIQIQTYSTASSRGVAEAFFKENKPVFMRIINSFKVLPKAVKNQ